MASVTVEEKRLRQLKQQLFGKEQPLTKETPNTKLQITKDKTPSKHIQTSAVVIDSVSLKKDFTKIISFSILAIAIQLSLFFANKAGLVKLFN